MVFMKRVLGLLLAVCMLCGVGVVGARALDLDLGEEYWGDAVSFLDYLTFDEAEEIKATVRPLRAYHNYINFFKNYPVIEAERAAALKVPGTPYVDSGAFLGAVKMAGGELGGNTYGNLVRYVRGTLQEEVEQAILDADTYLNAIFDNAYFEQLKAFQMAFAAGDFLSRHMDSIISYYKDEIVNYDEIMEDRTAYVQWFNSNWSPTCQNGTLAALTAFYEEEAVRAKAIIDKIQFANETDDPDPDPDPEADKIYDFFASFLPSALASLLTWIVKYILFGWLWGRWL